MTNIFIDYNLLKNNIQLKKGISYVIKRKGVTVTVTNKNNLKNRKNAVNNLFNIKK